MHGECEVTIGAAEPRQREAAFGRLLIRPYDWITFRDLRGERAPVVKLTIRADERLRRIARFGEEVAEVIAANFRQRLRVVRSIARAILQESHLHRIRGEVCETLFHREVETRAAEAERSRHTRDNVALCIGNFRHELARRRFGPHGVEDRNRHAVDFEFTGREDRKRDVAEVR